MVTRFEENELVTSVIIMIFFHGAKSIFGRKRNVVITPIWQGVVGIFTVHKTVGGSLPPFARSTKRRNTIQYRGLRRRSLDESVVSQECAKTFQQV